MSNFLKLPQNSGISNKSLTTQRRADRTIAITAVIKTIIMAYSSAVTPTDKG